MILNFIRDLLKNEPNTIYKVPWQVKDYKQVMKMLFDFKNKEGKLIIEGYKHILRMMFTFHLQDENHVMVFYSNNKDGVYVWRYKSQHININMPVADVVMNADSSFVATYVPEEKNEPI